MAEWKYVVIRATGYDYPIIFPDKLVHEDVARAGIRLVNDNLFRGSGKHPHAWLLSGGGIYTLNASGFNHGSETLNLEHDDRRQALDETLIGNFNYNHGISDTNT